MDKLLSGHDIHAAVARARSRRSDALGRLVLGARVRAYALALGIGGAALWAGALLLSPPPAEANAEGSQPAVPRTGVAIHGD